MGYQPEVAMGYQPVAQASVDVRATFIKRTYLHLLGAIMGFVLLEVWFFTSGMAEPMARAMLGRSWLLVLGGFMVTSWLARGLAARAESSAAQYGGLALYVVVQAIIFAPMLFIADSYAPGAIASAALLTGLGFVGLTLIVLQTRRDFSFLGGVLRWAGVLALVAIVGAVLFGWHLGTWFSLVMVGVAGAAILYDTSKILYYWPEDRYVGAALELFASVALMFWYILRLLMGSRR